MSNIWRYKIDLKDNSVFKKIEVNKGIVIPKEIKEFIIEHNGESPDDNCIVINGTERVLDSVLSFNEEELDAVNFDSAFNSINNKNLIPFAVDPFGNYYCFSLVHESVCYFKHEEQKIEITNYSIKKFIENLY